jgi:predicted RNase H-like HicB family nuclease
MNRIEFFGRKSYRSWVVELNEYKKAALKRAQVKFLGADEGYSARIPGFAGLIVFGQTKREALAELESALEGWIELSLSRGDGLPSLRRQLVEAR